MPSNRLIIETYLGSTRNGRKTHTDSYKCKSWERAEEITFGRIYVVNAIYYDKNGNDTTIIKR